MKSAQALQCYTLKSVKHQPTNAAASVIRMLRTMKIRNITSACYHLWLLSNKSDQCHKTHRMQFHLMAQYKTTGADCDECL